MATPSNPVGVHDVRPAEVKRALEADQEGRFLEALGLEPVAGVDDIRLRQVELVHRMRSFPDAVAAVNHAAEMAVDECNSRLDIGSLVPQIEQRWLPCWGIPAADYPRFLRARFHLDKLLEHHVRVAYRATHLREAELAEAAVNSALDRLHQQESELRSDMADWYCSCAAEERKKLHTHLNEVASTNVSRLPPEVRIALPKFEGPITFWIGNALRLAPDKPEISAFLQAVQKDTADLELISKTPPSRHQTTSAQSQAPSARPGFMDTPVGGCLAQLVGWGVMMGAILLLGFLCDTCGKR